ncbi:MAG TPA: endolytic transglycosylase MltG [Acidimicrobiia bacterium]|nr:endolytic transglycosylase MltG [Acidimicrobiia bacterium]
MTQSPIPPSPSPWRLARPVLVVLVVVVAAFALVSVASSHGERVGQSVASNDEEELVEVEPGRRVEVVIPPGASAERIGEILRDAGLVRSAGQFETAARAAGVDASLQSGTYEFITGSTIQEILDELRAGPRVVVFDVTIREGLRVTEIIDVLAEASGIDRLEFVEALESGGVSTDVATLPPEPTLAHWEGLLFPDTYRFSEQATAVDMLGRLANTMRQRMDAVDWSALEAAGYTRYEGIIIASLIESEVRVAEERPIVSSVIWNRLADGARLDIDATVLYAMGTRDPAAIDVSFESPYNTRLVGGLPPGPISAPGLASLQAAAAPADTEFRYYVLAAEDGSHAFAVTLEEHNANVAAAREAGILP